MVRLPAGWRARAGGTGARAAWPHARQAAAVQRLGPAAAVSCAGALCRSGQARHVFGHAAPGPSAHWQKHMLALPAFLEGSNSNLFCGRAVSSMPEERG